MACETSKMTSIVILVDKVSGVLAINWAINLGNASEAKAVRIRKKNPKENNHLNGLMYEKIRSAFFKSLTLMGFFFSFSNCKKIK
jgi:hypothetical protein